MRKISSTATNRGHFSHFIIQNNQMPKNLEYDANVNIRSSPDVQRLLRNTNIQYRFVTPEQSKPNTSLPLKLMENSRSISTSHTYCPTLQDTCCIKKGFRLRKRNASIESINIHERSVKSDITASKRVPLCPDKSRTSFNQIALVNPRNTKISATQEPLSRFELLHLLSQNRSNETNKHTNNYFSTPPLFSSHFVKPPLKNYSSMRTTDNLIYTNSVMKPLTSVCLPDDISSCVSKTKTFEDQSIKNFNPFQATNEKYVVINPSRKYSNIKPVKFWDNNQTIVRTSRDNSHLNRYLPYMDINHIRKANLTFESQNYKKQSTTQKVQEQMNETFLNNNQQQTLSPSRRKNGLCLQNGKMVHVASPVLYQHQSNANNDINQMVNNPPNIKNIIAEKTFAIRKEINSLKRLKSRKFKRYELSMERLCYLRESVRERKETLISQSPRNNCTVNEDLREKNIYNTILFKKKIEIFERNAVSVFKNVMHIEKQRLLEEMWRKVQICEKCGVYGLHLACGLCNKTFYCSKQCQTTDWNEKHQEICKLKRKLVASE